MGPQAGDTFRVELVKAARAGAGIGDEAGLFEDFEVLRYGGTADGKLAGKLVDGEGTGGELLEDGHAGGIAEGVESGL